MLRNKLVKDRMNGPRSMNRWSLGIELGTRLIARNFLHQDHYSFGLFVCSFFGCFFTNGICAHIHHPIHCVKLNKLNTIQNELIFRLVCEQVKFINHFRKSETCQNVSFTFSDSIASQFSIYMRWIDSKVDLVVQRI